MDSKTATINMNDSLKLLEDEYIKYKNLRIYCGTFNVNGKQPDELLAPWLCLQSDKQVDIYALGFQELVDLTTTNLLLRDSNDREQTWINAINNELLNEKNFRHSSSKYVLLDKLRMFGLFMVVYVNQKLVEKNAIKQVLKSYVATGLMDLVGNKGSVALSVKIEETRLCFVCSHFASDTDKLEKRNSDYRASKQKLKFQDDEYVNSNGTAGSSYDLENDHDFIFWFGDLNYRLETLSLHDTLRFISGSNYEQLVKYDQLTNQRDRQRVFENYVEGALRFKPTYKYLIKSDLYEKQLPLGADLAEINSTASSTSTSSLSSSSGSVKLPSWTDRVMYKCTSSKLKCQLVQYSCINTITISDHKPVYAMFDVDVKKIDRKKYAKLYENYLKESDRKYNEELPHIAVDKFDFNFGECLFYDMKHSNMQIRNESRTLSNVNIFFYETQMLNKLTLVDSNHNSLQQQQPPQYQWVTVQPQHKAHLDGQASYNVRINTSFNYEMLAHLNRNPKLDDFLIIKCLNGNDLFVTLSCSYKRTIIGISLKTLSTLKDAETFSAADQNSLVAVIEQEVDDHEKQLDDLFRGRLKANTIEYQIENAQKSVFHTSVGSSSSSSSSSPSNILNSRVDIYRKTLMDLNKEIIDDDPMFRNNLSSEYVFFLEYLIELCENQTKSGLNKSGQSGSPTVDKDSSSSAANLTIEEQKNLILTLLSEKKFEKVRSANFDLELLAEMLYDLLYALPHPLISNRYFDYCVYADSNYELAKSLFDFVPRSQFQLFELIVKFLQIYLKLLSTNDSNYSHLIAQACFQLNKSNDGQSVHSPGATKFNRSTSNSTLAGQPSKVDYKSQTAIKFIQLFINAHNKRSSN